MLIGSNQIVYMPYITMTSEKVIISDNFNPNFVLKSRYAIKKVGKINLIRKSKIQNIFKTENPT